MRYRARARITCEVTAKVEADNKEEALEKILEKSSGIHQFVGNGGSDKLIGLYSGDGIVESIEVLDEEIPYDEVELINE